MTASRCANAARVSVVTVILLTICVQLTAAAGARLRRNEAVVLTYVPSDNREHASAMWDGLRAMIHWLVHDPARCTCRDVVILVADSTPDEQRLQLEEDGAIVVPVKNPGISFRGGEPRWANGWAKLMPWNLTQYHRALMIDTDMVMLDRIDSLFDWVAERFTPSCSVGAVGDIEWDPSNPGGQFNSGVLMMFPDAETFDALIRHANSKEFQDSGVLADQVLLNQYFQKPPRRWCKIPNRYHRFPSYRYPERNDTTTPEDVLAHGAAWLGMLNPQMTQMWEIGVQAVRERDRLNELMRQLGKVPVQPVCGRCLRHAGKWAVHGHGLGRPQAGRMQQMPVEG